MRLDFDNFDITETTAGVCTDSLTVTGPTGRNPMDLCGTLSGMHRKSFEIKIDSNIESVQTMKCHAWSSQKWIHLDKKSGTTCQDTPAIIAGILKWG